MIALILLPIIGLALIGLVSEFIRNDLEIREGARDES